MAAAGRSAQGIGVPPPTQIAATWPSAVNVAVPDPMAAPNIFATDPASDKTENPEPSSPVIAPVTAAVREPTTPLTGTLSASATPRSLTMPCDPAGNGSPGTAGKAASPK